MRKTYNKLVRDRIPEIIQREGRTYEVVTLSGLDYRQALLEKLVEEARETAEAPTDKLTMELADVLEVLEALAAATGIELETVRAEQARRRAERGGFEQRIKLLWTE